MENNYEIRFYTDLDSAKKNEYYRNSFKDNLDSAIDESVKIVKFVKGEGNAKIYKGTSLVARVSPGGNIIYYAPRKLQMAVVDQLRFVTGIGTFSIIQGEENPVVKTKEGTFSVDESKLNVLQHVIELLLEHTNASAIEEISIKTPAHSRYGNLIWYNSPKNNGEIIVLFGPY